ncbi:hypothetical protein JTB14_004598 [Gonioctena quinquepunctata]|nr:hypothetical protein JTB14_004598 [Gonioctena quinquepunctata]
MDVEREETEQVDNDSRLLRRRSYKVSGVYKIQPKLSKKPFMVLCDMETRGGGWAHIQKRFDGSQDFYLGWRDYKFGFGDLGGEFWLGLENIHLMTASADTELSVEMTALNQTKIYARYKAFKIGTEPEGYPLIILANYSGDAGDSLKNLGMKFTTKDFDQDTDDTRIVQKIW